MRIVTTSSSGFCAPAGGFHNCARRARSASSSFCVSCVAAALRRAERHGVVDRIAGRFLCAAASRLSSSASISRGSNFGCCAAAAASAASAILASTFFCSVFLASSFLIASAIRSRLGSAFFLAACFGCGRRRRRRIGRGGDFAWRDLRGRVFHRLLLADPLHERLLASPAWARSAGPASVSLLSVSVTMLTAMLSTCGGRQPRRRKAHQRRAQDDEMAAAPIWSSPSARGLPFFLLRNDFDIGPEARRP